MNFIIRLHRLCLSFVGKWKVVFKLREAEERQGCLWNSQSHRFRIFLIIKMSGYEKCQNMSSPSSGACLAGFIKSKYTSLAVIIRSDLSVCLVILGKIKKKRGGPIFGYFHFAHSFYFDIFCLDVCEGTNEEEWAGRCEGWRLEDGSSRLCLPTIITRLLPACCSWKPFHFWLCIKCILCHTRANLQLLCVVNYQIIINNNIQTTSTSLHVQKWCPQLNWSDSIFPSLNNRNT